MKPDAFGSSDEGPVTGVRRVAALRASGIGDLLVALPALDAVAAAYPEAEIVLLGLPWQAEFLAGRPGPVDRVVALPPIQGVSAPDAPGTPGPPASLVAELRREEFDLALQLHGGGRFSNPFVRALGARLAAGLRARRSPSATTRARCTWPGPSARRP